MGWLRLGAAILAIVAVTGLVSVPGGIGGPPNAGAGTGSSVVSAASGSGVVSAASGSGVGAEGPAVASRFDGADDTVRVKVWPTSEAGNDTIREHVPVRHRFGKIVTTDVTREQYRALAEAPDIAVRPVQRVSLLSHGGSHEGVEVRWRSPTDGERVDGTVQIEIEARSEDSSISEVRWQVDGQDANEATYDAEAGVWTATWDASSIADGTYELRAAAIDENFALAEHSITVTVGDPGGGQTAIAWQKPGENATIHERTRLQIDAQAPGDSVEQVAWTVDLGDPRPTSYNATSGYWEATLNPTDIDPGQHTLRTRMKTADGLTRTATIGVTIDTSIEPPRLEWLSPDDGETVEGMRPIRLNASDPDGSVREVRWQIEDRPPRRTYHDINSRTKHYEDRWNTTAEADGTYRLRAAAIDDDGATTVVIAHVEVDNSPTKPDVRWVAPTGGSAVANGVPVELTVDGKGRDVTDVRWQLDGGPPRPATYDENREAWIAQWNASAVPTGVHTLRASARTAAGGVGNATIEVTVDRPDGADDGTSYGVDQIYGGTVARPAGGDGIDVAVIDTGVSAAHPDLEGPLETCVTFVGGEACSDPHGHGTALAGTAVADGGGFDGIYGVAPDANLYAYRAVGPNGTGHADDVAAAIHRAAQDDVEIVVLGLQTEGTNSLVAREIAAHRDEVLVVAAAGNGGPGTDTLAHPAAHEAVLAVGAIDHDRRVLDTSSRGVTVAEFCACSGYIDVVAAGDGVTTTNRHGGYRRLTGTSIAAPQVAGVAAKAWASGRADLNRDGTVTPAEARAWVRAHARDVVRGQGATDGYDPASGAGLPVVD